MSLNKLALLAIAMALIGIILIFSAYPLYAELSAGLAAIRALVGTVIIIIAIAIIKRS